VDIGKGGGDEECVRGDREFLCVTKVVHCSQYLHRSRIHERTISFRFLGIILRVLILEVSV
jgi:hypothetical protein